MTGVKVVALVLVLSIYGSAVLFGYIFRYFDPRFDYATASGIYETKNPITGKSEDIGTCSKCNQITIVAKQGYIQLLGKRTRYTCSSCGRYIQGSPTNGISTGIFEILMCVILLCGTAVTMKGSSSNSGFITFVYMAGIFDGLKRVFYSVSSMFAKPEYKHNAIVINKPEYVTCERCSKEYNKQDCVGNVCQDCQLS